MGRKRTLADDLADLATTAPATEVDGDRDELGDDARLVESDEDADQEQEQARPKRARRAPEKALRLRAGIALEGAEYAGRRTPRAAAFGSGSDSEEAFGSERGVGDADESSAEEAAEDASGSSEDELPERAAGGIDSDASDATQSEGGREDAGAEPGDPYADAHASEAAAAAQLRARAAQEQARAEAARSQRAVWERLLETRILLQQALAASHQLPPPAARESRAGTLAASFGAAQEEARSVLDALLQLHGALAGQNPDLCAQQDGEGAQQESAEGGDEAWSRLEAARASDAAFRGAELDRWHRKTLLGGGLALGGGGLRALNQSISGQVAHALRDPARVAQRVQLPWEAAPRQLCAGGTAAPADGEGRQAGDPERFDDSDFYQQLLREFLQASGAEGAQAGPPAPSRSRKPRALADRRASKGRRLRFDVQEKLVNFMVAAKWEEPPMASQLFRNLFGRRTE